MATLICPSCRQAVMPGSSQCPHCGVMLVEERDDAEAAFAQAAQSAAEAVAPHRHTTVFEALEAPPMAVAASAAPHAETPPEAITYRPLKRPPTAQLVVLADGCRHAGEVRWIRVARHVIGRTRGDTRIPLDQDISAEHASITCRWQEGAYRWYLTDLQSTNGTFLQVRRAKLRHGREVLLGGRHYVLHAPEALPPGTETHYAEQSPGMRATRSYHAPSLEELQQLVPRLVERSATGDGRELVLRNRSQWLGSDADQCQLVVTDDPFLNRRHARLYKDRKNRWIVEDAESVNGVWVRVEQVALENEAQFQLGEQRFRFRVWKAEDQ